MSFFLLGLVLAAVFAGSPIEVTGEPTNPGLGTTFPNPQPPAPFPIPSLPSPHPSPSPPPVPPPSLQGARHDAGG
jgi:hypothetical protein